MLSLNDHLDCRKDSGRQSHRQGPKCQGGCVCGPLLARAWWRGGCGKGEESISAATVAAKAPGPSPSTATTTSTISPSCAFAARNHVTSYECMARSVRFAPAAHGAQARCYMYLRLAEACLGVHEDCKAYRRAEGQRLFEEEMERLPWKAESLPPPSSASGRSTCYL